MSQLSNVKAQIDALAQQATTLAGQLNASRSQFSQSVSQVQATIGGSAQGKDRQLVESITAAQRQVDAAAAALQQAAQAARSYGSSL